MHVALPHHLSSLAITDQIYLPTPQPASEPLVAFSEDQAGWCTWHFNPQGLSPSSITAKRRALLL